MKVKLKCGDSITIPEGCKAIVKDGSVVFEKEEKEQEFKDGDILVPVVDGHRYYAFIYKSTDKEGFHSYYVGIETCGRLSFSESLSDRWCNDDLSYATEEEKQLLFYEMKEKGLKWNAEEKRVEKIRWRASIDEKYHHIGKLLDCNSEKEEFLDFDEEMWEVGNYFRTEEQAKEAARRIKETLFKYHEEIGE